MERRQHGKTDMQTSVLGLGTSEIGVEGTPVETVARLINGALDSGCNVIDTGECYHDAEAKIGETVSHRRDEYFLFTKCGHNNQTARDLKDWDPKLLALTIDDSLRLLRTDRLDVVYIHSPGLDLIKNGGLVEVVQRAKEAGKTRYMGFSGDGEAARYALELGVFDSLETSVNIADQQSIDLLLPLAVEKGVGVTVKRPVANVAWKNGDLEPDRRYAFQYWERLKELQYDWLKGDFKASVAKAMRFALSQPGVSTMVVGTAKPERWAENAAIVAQGDLDPTEVEEIRTRWREVAPPDWVGLT